MIHDAPTITPPAAAAPPRRPDPTRRLLALRKRLWEKPAGSVVKFMDYRVRITDGPNAYMQFKDVFVRNNYRFTCDRPDPLVIDGGSNMGISILGFKRDFPQSRIIGFEPDPQIAELLKENLRRNEADSNVEVVVAGLADREGSVSFAPDGSSGGHIADKPSACSVKVVRLSSYLRSPVDFLKLNIEGVELSVLRECADAGVLRNVRKLVLEYHGWPDGPQRLGEILTLLDQQGFRYLVHDFDAESCGTSKPPFRLRAAAPWFCLVYAQQV